MRILQKPETARAAADRLSDRSSRRGDCVAAIIAAGIIPGGLEMMDQPAIHAAEDFVHAGYPLDAEALLIVELDGPAAEVDHLIGVVERDRRASTAQPTIRVSQSEAERARLLGRPQGRLPGRRPHLARLSTAWTARSRAARCPTC